MKNVHTQYTKAFTLVELVITIAIFAGMTAYLLAKYGTFNQSILLTNLAYDVALTIRTAQSYGLNVKSATLTTGESTGFNRPYGVHFNKQTLPTCFIFFSDNNDDFAYTSNESADTETCVQGNEIAYERISTYNIRRGSVIYDLCGSYGEGQECNPVDVLDVSFKRPDPEAHIITDGSSDYTRAEITLKATDGSMKKITVRSTGQIAIE